MSPIHTTADVALILGTTTENVAYWCKAGYVNALPRPTPRAPWKIPQSEVDRLLAEGAPPSARTLRRIETGCC